MMILDVLFHFLSKTVPWSPIDLSEYCQLNAITAEYIILQD